MSKFDSKAKVITLTALLASTTMVTYASQKALKSIEESAYTAKLLVDKIDKDTVKISLDNINNSAKAFQLSLEVDGDATFNEENITWLTSENEEERTNNNIVNSVKVSDDKKKIDIFVSSDNELNKQGAVLEVCEIDLSKTGTTKNSKYKIIPNIEEGKISYKSVDENNKSLEVESMNYDKDLVLSFNTAPIISLKTHVTLPELYEAESTEEGNDDGQVIENNNDPIIDADNNIITITEGYEFEAKSFIAIYDEDEELTLDNVKITDESGKEITTDKESLKPGNYKRIYTVTDSEGESATLEVDVVVKPEVWETNPTISGVPEESITIYTGDIFNPLKPDGKTDIVAKDAKDNSLEVKVSGEFSLEQGGNYTLTYTAKDRFDNIATAELNLIVIQDDAPVIEGIDDVVINVGTEFSPLDNVRVSDDNKELTVEDLKVTGKVTPNIPGEYTLYYELFDGRNTTKKQRKVIVNGAPTISGDLSYIIVKNGEELSDEQILKGIDVIDDIDEEIKSLVVDRGNLDTSVDGKYIVTITATDNSDLSSSVKREVLVTSDKVVELSDSGNGLSKEESIKKQVIDGSAIENINKELSDLTKNNEVTLSKTNVLENVIYSIKVTPNKIAFRQVQNEYFVDITVPKAIDEATGGIVITKYEAIKISSINISGNNGEMKVGDERVLNTTVEPENAENKELLWVSTNNDIVSIVPSEDSQSATIKALKKGTSTIRVIATDGSGEYKELVVQVGEQPKEDTEAPVFDYEGKTDIVVANGMMFKTPEITASDNVDTGIIVNVSITDEDGLNVEEIDTTRAGKYKIIYTAKDKSGNKAELTINVTVKEAISGIEIGSGNATSEEKALVINILTEVEGLNKLLEAIKEDGYEPKIYGEPTLNEIKNEITYIVKIYKKQNFLNKLFNLFAANENQEVYYLKVTVENTNEINDILNKLDKEKVEVPEVPEKPEDPKDPVVPEKPEEEDSEVIIIPGEIDEIDDSQNSSEQGQLVAQDSQKHDTEDTKDSNEKVDSNKVENKPVDSNELENIEDNTDENTVDTSNRNILGYLGLAGVSLALLFIFIKNKIKKNK